MAEKKKYMTKTVEGKEDVRSVNAEQGCSHTELLIIGNDNKLVFSTSQITELSLITFSLLSYGQISRFYTSTP